MGLRRKLASHSVLIFGMRLFGAGLVFLAQAAIARFWGPTLLGEYLLIIATVNLVSVVMPLGFQTVGTYFAAEYRARGEGRQLWSFLARAYGHVLLILALLVFGGRHVLPFFGEPGEVLQAHWLPACLLALGTALVYVNGAVLVGMRRPFAGFFADTMFRPMAVIAAFAISLPVADPQAAFAEMLWIVSLAYVAVALVHFGFVVTTAREVPLEPAPRPAEARRWWRFAMPWVLVSLATDFFFDIDLLLLSGHLSREELAIFGVCTRMFSLVSFGVAAVYAVTLPDMFESEAKSDRQGFHRKIGDANLVAAMLSVGLFVGMGLAGPLALLLFGPDFLAGAGPLAVLCLSLVVRSVFGPASLVLSIHDRPYASLPSVALGMVTLALANLALVPACGLMGAAIAALLAISVWNFALWLTALRTAGIDVSIWPRLRRGPAATAA